MFRWWNPIDYICLLGRVLTDPIETIVRHYDQDVPARHRPGPRRTEGCLPTPTSQGPAPQPRRETSNGTTQEGTRAPSA
jgi:hypothetical protein